MIKIILTDLSNTPHEELRNVISLIAGYLPEYNEREDHETIPEGVYTPTYIQQTGRGYEKIFTEDTSLLKKFEVQTDSAHPDNMDAVKIHPDIKTASHEFLDQVAGFPSKKRGRKSKTTPVSGATETKVTEDGFRIVSQTDVTTEELSLTPSIPAVPLPPVEDFNSLMEKIVLITTEKKATIQDVIKIIKDKTGFTSIPALAQRPELVSIVSTALDKYLTKDWL